MSRVNKLRIVFNFELDLEVSSKVQVRCGAKKKEVLIGLYLVRKTIQEHEVRRPCCTTKLYFSVGGRGDDESL